MNAAPTYVLTIEQHQEKQRVDQLLSTHPVIQESRAQIQRWIQQGAVQLNGRSPKPSERVKQGDVLTLHVPPPQSYSVKAQAIDLDVVFEDEHLIVINKPVGMVVHPAPGHPDHTLVNALLHHCGDLSGIGGVLRPGIVHRLDKETSGLMVAAKHDRAHQSLAALFKNKDPQQLDRRYLAIVRGQVKDASGWIRTPYGRHPKARKKFTGQGSLPTDKEAITAFWRKQVFTWATLIECQLHTGRTHQIRVHFAERHHPLIGDPLYAPKAPRQWPKRLAQFQRQALHAFQLHFVHPVTQEMLRFQSAPPPDMEALLHFLRSTENTP